METITQVVIGDEAIRQLVKQLIEKNAAKLKEIYGFSNLDILMANFPEHAFNLSNPTRTEAAVPSKLIYTSQYGPIAATTDAAYNRQSRFLPFTEFPFTCDFSIIGDNVMFLVMKNREEPVAINIQNQQMAKDFVTLFGTIWKMAETIQA